MQSKRNSWLEAIANTLIGYVIAILAQLLIFPIFGIHIAFTDDLLIGLCFLVISLVRSYVLRRIFNSFKEKQNV